MAIPNLYQILGISPYADEAAVRQAIGSHFAAGTVAQPILEKAREWLLNPDTRARYNTRLFAEHPELVHQPPDLSTSHPPSAHPLPPPESAPSGLLSAGPAPAQNFAAQPSRYKQAQQQAEPQQARHSGSGHPVWLARAVVAALLTVVLGLGTYYYASPYLAMRSLAHAVEERDIEAMSAYIDYPAVRENVATQLKHELAQKLHDDPHLGSNPVSGMAENLIGAMVDSVVGKAISKEGMKVLLQNGNIRQPYAAAGATEESAAARARLRKGQSAYDDLTHFHVTTTTPQGHPITFRFERQGFATWQMKAIDLPLQQLLSRQ